MSYCVHCGVELDATAKKCALCSTPVFEPGFVSSADNTEKPFSEDVHIPKNIQRKFISYVITMIMLIPCIVLFLVNVLFYRSEHWALYITASTLLVWVLFVFPFFTNKPKPYLMWAVDTVAVAAYSYFFFVMGREHTSFLLSIFTVIALLSVFSLIMIIWMRRKTHHWTAVLVHIFIDLFLFFLIAGFFVSFFTKNYDFFSVGLICALCAAAISGFFIYCNKSKRIRAWMNKAFYI